MDKGSAARQVASLIQAPCQMLRSPMGLDANDLLCKGWLWGLLEKVLAKVGFKEFQTFNHSCIERSDPAKKQISEVVPALCSDYPLSIR